MPNVSAPLLFQTYFYFDYQRLVKYVARVLEHGYEADMAVNFLRYL